MNDLLHLFASKGGQLALGGLLGLTGLFLAGLCFASLAHRGKTMAGRGPSRWTWWRRAALAPHPPSIRREDRKADEDLLARDGIFVTFDRLGPDEHDSTQDLARQRDIHRD